MPPFFTKVFFNNIWFKFQYKNYSISPLKLLQNLNESQYWTRNQIEEAQIGQLKNIVSIAKQSNDFYKKLYSNIDIRKIETFEEFNKLPYILKKDIQKNNLEIPSSNSLIFKATTSGSTGDPLTVYLNDIAMAYRIAGRYRFYSWWGIARSVYEKLIKRNFKISIFKLNNDTIKYYYDLILKYKPKYLYGYTSALKQFAELLESKNLNGKLLNIKIAIVTSEVLIENDREYIEKIIGCKVVNEYGAADGGLYAFECPHGGMHVFEESVYMSTNNNNEVITTEFFNDRMPLVNYKIGDRVFFNNEKCTCGRTLKTIKSIEGRAGDVIIKPNGESLSQYFFYYLMKNIDDDGYKEGINKYKVIQKGKKFDFYIVQGKNFNPEIETYILKSMKKDIGTEIIVDFIYVSELPREESGKLRFFKRLSD